MTVSVYRSSRLVENWSEDTDRETRTTNSHTCCNARGTLDGQEHLVLHPRSQWQRHDNRSVLCICSSTANKYKICTSNTLGETDLLQQCVSRQNSWSSSFSPKWRKGWQDWQSYGHIRRNRRDAVHCVNDAPDPVSVVFVFSLRR